MNKEAIRSITTSASTGRRKQSSPSSYAKEVEKLLERDGMILWQIFDFLWLSRKVPAFSVAKPGRPAQNWLWNEKGLQTALQLPCPPVRKQAKCARWKFRRCHSLNLMPC